LQDFERDLKICFQSGGKKRKGTASGGRNKKTKALTGIEEMDEYMQTNGTENFTVGQQEAI
jgi:hypothetical protein